ncbi:MAG: hypothetical protein M3Z27_10030, partial [Actinomycetota bacterium]|nr:hypothetical protein [Actinomycetota bacterium]
MLRLRWLLGALALLSISFAVARWAGTRPGYDPYGWLVWGKLTVHGSLDTNGAPSWKPLPFLFTVPFSLFGHLALWLWMVTAVAVSLSGPVFAGRIAHGLTGAGPGCRYAGYLAGAAAALALLGTPDYTHSILSAESDTMIVSLCLAAIDCGLRGRTRWALWLWVLAALGRPEAWPLLALYAAWGWRREAALRPMIVVGVVLVGLLWFGIPALTAKSAFIAGDNALNSPRELHSDKVLGTLDRFLDLQELPVWLAAALTVSLAAIRRRALILLLAAGATLWVAVEVAFVLRGYPGVPRYLLEPVAVVCVLGGVLVGRLLVELPDLARRLAPQAGLRAGTALAALLVVAFAGALVPAARSRIRQERHDLRNERARAHLLERLDVLVGRLGPARILRCGAPDVPISYQSVFAWYTGMKIGTLYVNQRLERVHPAALVSIAPRRGGWSATPRHLPPGRAR